MPDLETQISTDQPVVSIVIPTYNRAALIGETLDSVAAQTYQNWECIVIDDGSTDDTAEKVHQWVEKDARFQFLRRPDSKPKGGNACRNFGFDMSKGAYINFLDSDDLLVPTKLEEQLAAFENGSELDMVTCKQSIFDENGNRKMPGSFYAEMENWMEAVWLERKFGTLWQTNSPLWKRDALQSVGIWNESLKNWQDHELNLRAMLYGFKIERLDRVLNLVRCGNRDRVFADDPAYWRERRRSLAVGWEHIETASAVSESLKSAAKLAFLDCGKRIVRNGRRIDGVQGWLADSKKICLTPISRFLGSLLLIIHKYRRMTRLRSWIEKQI